MEYVLTSNLTPYEDMEGKFLGILGVQKNGALFSHIHGRPHHKCERNEHNFPYSGSI